MADQLEVLIQWEIDALQHKLEGLKKDLHSLMIDRNTAALRVIALENAGLPYPLDVEDLESLDQKVANMVQEIQFTNQQIDAWIRLFQNLNTTDVMQQVRPMIRTVELHQRPDGS